MDKFYLSVRLLNTGGCNYLINHQKISVIATLFKQKTEVIERSNELFENNF